MPSLFILVSSSFCTRSFFLSQPHLIPPLPSLRSGRSKHGQIYTVKVVTASPGGLGCAPDTVCFHEVTSFFFFTSPWKPSVKFMFWLMSSFPWLFTATLTLCAAHQHACMASDKFN